MRRRARVVSGVVLGAALLLGGAELMQRRQAAEQAALGQALFAGEQALVGRLPGHDTALPSLATRCVNCHEAPNPAPAPAPAASYANANANANGVPAAGPAPDALAAGSYAPALNRQTLLGRQGRRGGPPSSYDLDALCVLLRRGVDPALVVVSTTMPRFELSDEQCRALWRFLSSR